MAAPGAVTIEVRFTGMRAIQDKLDQVEGDLDGGAPVRAVLGKALNAAVKVAKGHAKVDTGVYRQSISASIQTFSSGEVEGSLFSKVDHAPFSILDTEPHFAPPAALTAWALRHGMSPFLVWWSVAQRGTRGDYSLQEGAETLLHRAEPELDRMVAEVLSR